MAHCGKAIKESLYRLQKSTWFSMDRRVCRLEEEEKDRARSERATYIVDIIGCVVVVLLIAMLVISVVKVG